MTAKRLRRALNYCDANRETFSSRVRLVQLLYPAAYLLMEEAEDRKIRGEIEEYDRFRDASSAINGLISAIERLSTDDLISEEVWPNK